MIFLSAKKLFYPTIFFFKKLAKNSEFYIIIVSSRDNHIVRVTNILAGLMQNFRKENKKCKCIQLAFQKGGKI